MATYSELIATINDQIKANGNQEITGPVLNAVLQAMVTALGAYNAENFAFIPTLNFLPNIDTANKIIDFGEDPVFIVGNTILGASNFSQNLRRVQYYQTDGSGDLASGAIAIVLNIDTIEIKAQVVSSNPIDDSNKIVLGTLRLEYNTHNFIDANFPFEFTVDGKSSYNSDRFLSMTSDILPNIDTVNKIIDLGKDPVLKYGNQSWGLTTLFPNNSDIYRKINYVSGSFNTYIIFNPTSGFRFIAWSEKLNKDDYILMGLRVNPLNGENIVMVNSLFDYTINGRTSNTQTLSYIGEIPPALKSLKCKILYKGTDFVNNSKNTFDTQGFDIAGNYIIQGNYIASSQLSSLSLMNTETMNIDAWFVNSDWKHVNNINVGHTNDGYNLPVIAVSPMDNSCKFLQIHNDLQGYDTLFTVTYIGSKFAGECQFVNDLDNNLLYAMGYKYGTDQTDGILYFCAFNYPSAETTLEDGDIIKEFEINIKTKGTYVFQGAKIFNNYLYLPCGYGFQKENPAMLLSVDLNTYDIISSVNIQDLFGSSSGYYEPEGIVILEKALLLVDNSTNPRYLEIYID